METNKRRESGGLPMKKATIITTVASENVIALNPSELPLHWNGVRWSTYAPTDKFTVVEDAEPIAVREFGR
jgi:hypothetical protein